MQLQTVRKYDLHRLHPKHRHRQNDVFKIGPQMYFDAVCICQNLISHNSRLNGARKSTNFWMIWAYVKRSENFRNKSILGERGPPPRRICSGSIVCIRTTDPGDFQNLTGTSLSKMFKKPSKTPGSRSGSGWLPKFHQFFLVHKHICGKTFRKTRSVVFT